MHDRVGREHLTGTGRGLDALRSRDSDPADLLPGELCLSDMKARPDVQPELPHATDYRECAPHPRGWAPERGEEAIARRVDLPAAVPAQLFAYLRVVAGLQLSPPSVAELDSYFARGDDVGE